MKEKIMRWNYKKAFLTIVIFAVVLAWLYKSAVCEGMNKSLRPLLGLFCNIFAVFAFLIVRDRPGRRKPEAVV